MFASDASALGLIGAPGVLAGAALPEVTNLGSRPAYWKTNTGNREPRICCAESAIDPSRLISYQFKLSARPAAEIGIREAYRNIEPK